MLILCDRVNNSTAWKATDDEWRMLAAVLNSGEGHIGLCTGITPEPYGEALRLLVVRTTLSRLASIRLSGDSSLLIEGSRESLTVLADNAVNMPELGMREHCHIDALILSGYLADDSVFSVWERSSSC